MQSEVENPYGCIFILPKSNILQSLASVLKIFQTYVFALICLDAVSFLI